MKQNHSMEFVAISFHKFTIQITNKKRLNTRPLFPLFCHKIMSVAVRFLLSQAQNVHCLCDYSDHERHATCSSIFVSAHKRPCSLLPAVFFLFGRDAPKKLLSKIQEIREKLGIWGLGVWGAIFTANIIKRIARELRRIILLHFGLIFVWIHYWKNRKPFISWSQDLADVTMTLKTNYS